MSRVYDRMRRQNRDCLAVMVDNGVGWSADLGSISADLIGQAREALDKATVVSADEVARYWQAMQGSEWLELTDLPALSLPISPVFIEARYPGWPSGVRAPFITGSEEELLPPYAT